MNASFPTEAKHIGVRFRAIFVAGQLSDSFVADANAKRPETGR